MFDERGLDRFMAHPMRSLHAGFVGKRRPLRDLLADHSPTTITQEGEIFGYDREEIRRWAAVATEDEAVELRLPLTLRFDLNLPDSCFLDDGLGAKLLRRLEGFGRAYPYRDGRMYLPYSLGFELLMKYPTTLQMILLG